MAAAWAQGVTGKNITTAIMDDGVDYMHPDLINNYVREEKTYLTDDVAYDIEDMQDSNP